MVTTQNNQERLGAARHVALGRPIHRRSKRRGVGRVSRAARLPAGVGAGNVNVLSDLPYTTGAPSPRHRHPPCLVTLCITAFVIAACQGLQSARLGAGR